MKLLIEIPDKYSERNLYLFAGMEPVWRLRKTTGYEEEKVEECSRCGKCCMAIDERHPLGTENGCRYLKQSGNEWPCELGIFRPFGCAIAEMDMIEECTVKWEAIK